MNLARFRFSIPRCTCLEEPFQHVHLLPTRGSHYITDKQYAFGTRLYIPCALPCAFPTTKLSGSKQSERPESNRNPGRDPVSLPLTYIPHNPDPRVSKVFIVLCLPRVVSNALSFQKKNVNKNFIQGGVPSCVPDGKYTRQDSNLFNFPLKRAYQLQKLKKGGLKRKC